MESSPRRPREHGQTGPSSCGEQSFLLSFDLSQKQEGSSSRFSTLSSQENESRNSKRSRCRVPTFGFFLRDPHETVENQLWWRRYISCFESSVTALIIAYGSFRTWGTGWAADTWLITNHTASTRFLFGCAVFLVKTLLTAQIFSLKAWMTKRRRWCLWCSIIVDWVTIILFIFTHLDFSVLFSTQRWTDNITAFSGLFVICMNKCYYVVKTSSMTGWHYHLIKPLWWSSAKPRLFIHPADRERCGRLGEEHLALSRWMFRFPPSSTVAASWVYQNWAGLKKKEKKSCLLTESEPDRKQTKTRS